MSTKTTITRPSDKKLRIGWLWASPDQWMLHRTTKDALWKALENEDVSLTDMFKLLAVKEEWIEVRPEDKIPINYHMFLFIWKQYLKVFRKMNPPIIYRLGIKKVGIFLLTLFKEDSAYTERFGGIVQYIIDHHEDWPKGDKQARLMAMQDVKEWWVDEDWRTRGKDKLTRAFDKLIYLYDTVPFVQQSIDFIIDLILANKDKWNRADGFFEPINWYPRGKGQINYVIHGRTS